MSKRKSDYQCPQAATLAGRLAEPRRFLQVVAGPRPVGKSTLVQQVTGRIEVAVRFVSADEPTLRGRGLSTMPATPEQKAVPASVQ